MKSHLIMITGGIASGKSRFALEKARLIPGRRIFVPTALPTPDMQERIDAHQKERKKDFQTVIWAKKDALYTQPLEKRLASLSYQDTSVLLLDCLTLWLAYVREHNTEEETLKKAKALCTTLLNFPHPCFVVTDQVGLGGIHPRMLSFQRLYGQIQQHFAAHAREIYLVVMGHPVCLKFEGKEKLS